MDAAKIIPVLIIAGCVAWYAYDQVQKNKMVAQGLIVSDAESSCDDVRKSLTKFDGVQLKPEQRVEQACRLHVCDMSFMHGKNVLFKKPYGGLQLEQSGLMRTLKQPFSIVETDGKLAYSFSCTVHIKDIERGGAVPVGSLSVTREQ